MIQLIKSFAISSLFLLLSYLQLDSYEATALSVYKGNGYFYSGVTECKSIDTPKLSLGF